MSKMKLLIFCWGSYQMLIVTRSPRANDYIKVTSLLKDTTYAHLIEPKESKI